jgi:hypothetical protein
MQNAQIFYNVLDSPDLYGIGLSHNGGDLASVDIFNNINYALSNKKIKRILYKFYCILYILIRYPRLFTKDIILLFKTDQIDIFSFISVSVNWFYIIYILKVRNSKTTNKIVLDQGIFQALWSIMYSSRKKIDYRLFLNDKALPSRIYFLEANDKELIKRYFERKRNDRIKYSSDDLLQKAKSTMINILVIIQDYGYIEI